MYVKRALLARGITLITASQKTEINNKLTGSQSRRYLATGILFIIICVCVCKCREREREIFDTNPWKLNLSDVGYNKTHVWIGLDYAFKIYGLYALNFLTPIGEALYGHLV